MPKFAEISSYVINKLKHYFNCKGPGFLIVGFDYIIDASGEIFLIEMNKRPAIYEKDNPMREIIHKNLEHELIPDTVNLALESLTNNLPLPEQDFGGWKFIR
jgi:hypothetical protein